MRERGLKFDLLTLKYSLSSRSREGAWIEIMPFMEMVTPKQVAPVRERGLKCLCNAYSAAGRCRSRKGAWIEIHTAIEAYGDGP